jgi:hypothetical protein
MVNVPPEPDQHKKQCTTCSELIAASALKCIHCDSYQDWRRYLAFSSTVLALLVALLSVATVAGPVFHDLLTTKDSDLAVGSFQGFNDDGEAMFVVLNSGNRPGTVADAYVLIAPLDKPHESIYFAGFPRGKLSSEESFFVDGGKSKLVRFHGRPGSQEPKLLWEGQNVQRFQCAIGVWVINFSGLRKSRCFEFDCEALGNLFPGHAPPEEDTPQICPHNAFSRSASALPVDFKGNSKGYLSLGKGGPVPEMGLILRRQRSRIRPTPSRPAPPTGLAPDPI